MSRKAKALRAFLYQNPNATVSEAWDAAWKNKQDIFHAKSIQDLEAKIETLREINRQHRSDMEILYAENLELKSKLADRQAKIDMLMLEYCPDEMTPEQLEEWGRNQKPSQFTELEIAALKAAGVLAERGEI